MRSRAIHRLVLCFATLWFGVLVPVHNRGQITLPGAREPAQGCCNTSAGTRTQSHQHCPDRAPRSPGTCAVCYFIAGLDVAPPVTSVEQRLGFVETAPVAATEVAVPASRFLPFDSRGPPLV